MSAPDLTPKLVLGHRFIVKKNTHFLNEDEVIYISGTILIFQNLIKNAQKYLTIPHSETHVLLLSPQR